MIVDTMWVFMSLCLCLVITVESKHHYDKIFNNKHYGTQVFPEDNNSDSSGDDKYSRAERNRETQVDYGLARNIFDNYDKKRDPAERKTKDTVVADCSYTFVVKYPQVPECAKRQDRVQKVVRRDMVKLEARMIARDSYTRKEMKEMQAKLLAEQSGMQNMKEKMRIQSDEQKTFTETYASLQNQMVVLHDTMLDLRKQLQVIDQARRRRHEGQSPMTSNTRRTNNVQGRVTEQQEYRRMKTVGHPTSQSDHARTRYNCTLPNRSFGGHCYVYTRKKYNWQQARKNCEKLGGNLVAIESADEQRFVQNFLRTLRAKRDGYWVYAGGNDPHKQSRWSWVPDNREIVSPTFWFTNVTPPPQTSNTCMFLLLWDPAKYAYWTRDKCHYAMPSLCEVANLRG